MSGADHASTNVTAASPAAAVAPSTGSTPQLAARVARRKWLMAGALLPAPLAIVALQLLQDSAFGAPGAGALLVLGVVVSAVAGGPLAALISAELAVAYAAWTYSLPGDLFHYAPPDLLQLFIVAVSAPAAGLVTGRLHTRVEQVELELRRRLDEPQTNGSTTTDQGQRFTSTEH